MSTSRRWRSGPTQSAHRDGAASSRRRVFASERALGSDLIWFCLILATQARQVHAESKANENKSVRPAAPAAEAPVVHSAEVLSWGIELEDDGDEDDGDGGGRGGGGEG